MVVDKAKDAWMNMAMDEAVLMHCIEGESPPTVRFYEWEKPSISIGYAVDAEAELNLPLCRERDVPVVRRITGGGIVFHKCDITYTVIFPEDFATEQHGSAGKALSVPESYRLVNRALAEGLSKLGIVTSLLEREKDTADSRQETANICFANPTVYDILYESRKLAGGAQRRKKGWILHQGSMLLSSDFVTMYPLLAGSVARGAVSLGASRRAPQEAYDNPMTRTAVCLEEILGRKPDRDRIVEALSENFARALGIKLEPSPLTESELRMAECLRAEKYSTDHWNLRRAIRPGG